MHRSLQPPDSRTYSVEVTSFPSNLLHHRRLRLFKRLLIIQHQAVCVNSFFKYFFNFFVVFQGFLALFLFIETERIYFSQRSPISCAGRFALCTIQDVGGGLRAAPPRPLKKRAGTEAGPYFRRFYSFCILHSAFLHDFMQPHAAGDVQNKDHQPVQAVAGPEHQHLAPKLRLCKDADI